MANNIQSAIANFQVKISSYADLESVEKSVKSVQNKLKKITGSGTQKKPFVLYDLQSIDSAIKKVKQLQKELNKSIDRASVGGQTSQSTFDTADKRLASLERYNKKLLEQREILIGNNQIVSNYNSQWYKHNQVLSTATGLLKQYFSVYAIRSYAENMVKITAEFDMQRRALGSLIGDQAKAISIFNQIKQMALESPFTALELNKSAKQLAAYSIQAKDLVKTTKMLGDIASATGVEISRLILAYGQVKTAHYLRGQEVRQFTEAGVPILQDLATVMSEKLGQVLSPENIQDMISKKQVRFEDVKRALEYSTEEGGRFYNFQYEIAQTTYGKIQKFQDALQQGWERLGRDTKGVIDKVLDVSINVAKNLSSYVKALGIGLTIWSAINIKQKMSNAMLVHSAKLTTQIANNERIIAALQSTGHFSAANRLQGQTNKLLNDTRRLSYLQGRLEVLRAGTNKVTKSMSALQIATAKATTGVRIFLLTFKSALKGLGIGLLITVFTVILSKIISIREQRRQMQRELNDVKSEGLKEQERQVNNFNRLATALTKTKQGTDEYTKAKAKLTQAFGEIIPKEQLEYSYLLKQNGAYKEQIKLIRDLQNLRTKQELNETYITQHKEEGTESLAKRITGVDKDTAKNIAGAIYEGYMRGTYTTTKQIEDAVKVLSGGKATFNYKPQIKIKSSTVEPFRKEGYTYKKIPISTDSPYVAGKVDYYEITDTRAEYFKNNNPYRLTPEELDKLVEENEQTYSSNSGDGSGESIWKRQVNDMQEWVAMWSKAKQDYENMQEMFAKDKSIEKMWEMWEEQFGHIQDNIQNVLGRAFEKDDFFKAIENNNSFTDLINEYIAYVRKAIDRATDQKDKNILSDFLYNTLIPKITDANRREIEKGLEKFIKEIDNMLDHTKARIDLYDKIFKTTGDSMLAYNIASSFNGGGTLNRMKENREILQRLVNEYGSGTNLSGKSWVELYGEAEKLSGKIKDEYLKVLQEMRSGTEELITKALQGYEKMLSVEEKMMMSYSEYLRNVKEANENIEDEVTRNKVLEGLKRMYKQTELELQMESIKSSQFYIDLFNNIETAGVGSLSAMRKQLVFLSKESGLSARELKTLQDEIKKIDDRLKPKSYKITDIVKIPKKKDIRKLLDDISKTTEEYNEKLNIAEEKRAIFDKATTDFSEGKITRGEYDDARENSDMATEEAEEVRKKLDGLNEKMYEMESKHTKAWQYLESVLNEYGKALQGVGEIGSSVLGTMDNFSKMVSGRSSARITAGLNAWNEAVSSIQSGVNAFKNVGSSVSDIASKFAKIREARQVYQSTLAKEGAEAEATLQAQNVMTGAMATGYGAIAVAAVETGIAIYKMGQAIHDSNIQKRIEKIQDQIDSLEKSITGINNVMKKLAGNSYYRKQAEQIEVYRKQMNLAQQQLQLEREKSKGGDKDTIKGYKNTIDDYKQKVIDAQEQLFQSFLGSDVNGYLKGIVDTFVQARIQGENTFNALKKSFGEMITSMIEDTIMSSIIQRRFEGMFEAIRQASDKGSLSTTDVSRISAAGMQAIQDANNDLTAMFPLIESMRNMFGLSSSVAGSYGSAVQGMSEQTAGTLGGYMGAMLDQMSTQAKDVSLIREYVSLMAQNGGQTGASMMNEYQTQTLNNLASIQANTLRNANKVDQLYNLLESMRTVNNSGNGSVYGWQIVQD